MSELRQGDNKLTIEGVLLEKECVEGKSQAGKDYIRTDFTIGVGEKTEIRVKGFSTAITNAGNENPSYRSLKKACETYKSVADVGQEEATKVAINTGELRRNDYYGKDGQLNSFVEYSFSFIESVGNAEFEPKANFEVETYIQNITPEFEGEDETGRLKIAGLVALYGGKLVPQEFIVGDENAINYVESNYATGDTVKLRGQIVNSIETIKTVQEMDFGENIENIKTVTVRELLVNGGTSPYDEEMGLAYSDEIIKKGLVERETMLDEMKVKAQNKPASTGSSMNGFNTTKAEAHDIPF